jgi:HlyD family secretion protein
MSNAPSLLRPRNLILLAVAVLAAILAWRFLAGGGDAPAYRTAAVERGAVRVSISATGSLRALSTVDVGSQVSGQILEVLVDFNDRVERGQVIARIDPANFEARLTQVRADLASAHANLSAARVSLDEARANLKNAEAEFERRSSVFERGLISRTDYDASLAQRDAARARIASANASIRVAEAQVQQREAGVSNAELDLAYTVIRSPVDGVILLRAIEPGQTVAASFQTPVLFQIAEDLRQMQIDLSIDETDVGQIREGQPVRFTVDAFQGRDFRGVVHQIRLSASNVQNVITYPVVVRVDNPDASLLPGMTANAEIEIARREDVLRLPNAALRFRPADAPAETARVSPFAGLAEELPRLVAPLALSPAQQAAFEQDLAAMRERMAQRSGAQRPAAGAGNGGAAAPGGGQMPSADAMRQRMGGMLREAFAGFRGTLSAEQQSRFDTDLSTFLAARRVTAWVLERGRPVARTLRVGLSDATHTEILAGELGEGDDAIVGLAR